MKNQYILNLTCIDQLGIVATISSALAEMGLFILELAQFSDPSTEQFFMRIFFENTREIAKEDLIKKIDEVGAKFKITWNLQDKNFRPNVLIMVSKLSHCLNDLLYRWSNNALPINIKGILSNHEDLKGMVSWYQIPFHFFPLTSQTKKEQEEKLLQLIKQENIDLVVLARYMQILSEDVCKKMHGKIINIHHSFLPSFKGAKPYQQAFDRGVKIIGATAHYVTPELDEGAIIDQETIHVGHHQSVEEFMQLGQDIECQVLARAVKWHSEQRVILNNHKTVVFNP